MGDIYPSGTTLLLYIGLLHIFNFSRSLAVYSIILAKYVNPKLWKTAAIIFAIEIVLESTLQAVESWVLIYMVCISINHIGFSLYMFWLNYSNQIPRMRLRDEYELQPRIKSQEANESEERETSGDPLIISPEYERNEQSELQEQFDTAMLIPEN